MSDASKDRRAKAGKDEKEEERADVPLRLPMEEMRTCQREHLAAETTADKRTRLKQISTLQHKLKGYHLRVPLKVTSDCSR